MSETFRLDGHLYYSSSSKRFFRDSVEITMEEFYTAFFKRLRA